MYIQAWFTLIYVFNFVQIIPNKQNKEIQRKWNRRSLVICKAKKVFNYCSPLWKTIAALLSRHVTLIFLAKSEMSRQKQKSHLRVQIVSEQNLGGWKPENVAAASVDSGIFFFNSCWSRNLAGRSTNGNIVDWPSSTTAEMLTPYCDEDSLDDGITAPNA